MGDLIDLTTEEYSNLDTYLVIEKYVAKKYDKSTENSTRKSVEDFMLKEDHAVDVKSNNVDKKNYSPNMLSVKQMHKWVFEKRKELSFVFVDYKENAEEDTIEILSVSDLIPIEHISWECLSIEAQGYGVIQKVGELVVNDDQTKSEFYKGFLKGYDKYMEKERKKHEKFADKFLNPDDIDW